MKDTRGFSEQKYTYIIILLSGTRSDGPPGIFPKELSWELEIFPEHPPSSREVSLKTKKLTNNYTSVNRTTVYNKLLPVLCVTE